VNRRVAAAAAAGIVVLALAALLLRRESGPATEGAQDPAPSSAAVDATAQPPSEGAVPPAGDASAARAAGQAVPSTALGTGAAPLPPPDTPLAAMLDELEERARAGEARAACRLASELSRCAMLQRRREFRAMVDPSGGGPARGSRFEEWRIDATARLELQIERDEAVCAGIDRAQSRQSIQWLHRAASAGHVPSMASFATGAWMVYEPGFVHQPELVAAYARDAAAMATRAVEAGDTRLLLPLGLAYAGRSGMAAPLGELVEPDPAKARALLALAAETPAAEGGRRGQRRANVGERVMAELDATLDPAQRAAAEAEAARLRAAWPAKRAPIDAPPFDPLGPTEGLLQPADCER
jgi:hypothetical protein